MSQIKLKMRRKVVKGKSARGKRRDNWEEKSFWKASRKGDRSISVPGPVAGARGKLQTLVQARRAMRELQTASSHHSQADDSKEARTSTTSTTLSGNSNINSNKCTSDSNSNSNSEVESDSDWPDGEVLAHVLH
eukprot:g38403.t1